MALLPPKLLGLVGSLTLSLPIMLTLYLLVVKELMGAITVSRLGSTLDFGAIFGNFSRRRKRHDHLPEAETEVHDMLF